MTLFETILVNLVAADTLVPNGFEIVIAFWKKWWKKSNKNISKKQKYLAEKFHR